MTRKATIEDLPQMLDLFMAYAGEGLDKYGIVLDIKTAMTKLEVMIKDHAAYAHVIGGKIIGAIAGDLSKSYLGDETWFSEVFFYVYPDHRKCSALILKDAEDFLTEAGVDRIICANMGENPILDRFYRMRGYKFLQTHYIKRLNNDATRNLN